MSELLAQEITQLKTRLAMLEALEQAAGVGGFTDHGGLTGLGDDDHALYLLETGARDGATLQAQDFGSNGLAGDVIAESTGAAGVTIDGMLIKDGGLLAIADIVLDDGAGDSPQIQLVGGTNDDVVYIYLDDDAFGAGRSDLIIKLTGTNLFSSFYVKDANGATCMEVRGDKHVKVYGHLGVANATPGATYTIYGYETYTNNSGYQIGVYSYLAYDPTSNFTSTVSSVHAYLALRTAQVRTGGELVGVKSEVVVYGSRDARSLYLYGVKATIDVEDAGQYGGSGSGATYAASIYALTPAVDKGKVNNAYGVKIDRGIIGTGAINNLYGLYIGSIYGGAFNSYAIYTGSGKVRFGDSVYCTGLGVGAFTPLAKAHIDQLSSAGAMPVLYLDQADVDQVLMKVKATAQAASANRTLVADSDYGTPGALVGWIQVAIEDVGNRIADADYYIPIYATPT